MCTEKDPCVSLESQNSTGRSREQHHETARTVEAPTRAGGSVSQPLVVLAVAGGKPTLKLPEALPEAFVVQLVFKSVPKDFETFNVNYNTQTEEWNLEKLLAMCVQEEDRLKHSNGGQLVFNVQHKKKNFQNNKNYQNKRPFPPGRNQSESGPSNAPQQKDWSTFPVDKDQCLKCKGRGHYKRDCPEFLKELLRKGEDTITFVDESLYLSYDKSTW